MTSAPVIAKNLVVLSSPTSKTSNEEPNLDDSPELSDNPGPLEETPNIQDTTKQGGEGKPCDLAKLQSALRSAFGTNHWFHVVPLTSEESSMIKEKKKQFDIEFMSGKVLFDERNDEILGTVKIWATVRKLPEGLTRTQWRTLLFNDGDYAEVPIPRSPNDHINNIKLAPVFAFLWTPDLWTPKLEK
jgi:hypothetical protein